MNITAVSPRSLQPRAELRYHPQHVQHLVRNTDRYSNIQRDNINIQSDRLHRTPPLPRHAVRFVQAGNKEYFKGGPAQYMPARPSSPPPFARRPVQQPVQQPGGGFPVYRPYQPNHSTQPNFAMPHQSGGFPPYQPTRGAGSVPQDISQVQAVQKGGRPNFIAKFGEGVQDMGRGAGMQMAGAAMATAGTAKAAVYAPLTGVEFLGKAAVALTGGQAVYGDGAPSDHFVDGFATAGTGAAAMVAGTGQMITGAGKAALYTAGAGVQLGARSAGVAVGATAAVAYGAYKGAAWAGNQVKDTWVAQEFLGGFDVIASQKK